MDDQKKKRHTLERAKASHLSRQLQMRLRYAKLKVEHGWQRQNLNEVENLYFHHSIRHGGRPTSPPRPPTPVADDPALRLPVPLASVHPLPQSAQPAVSNATAPISTPASIPTTTALTYDSFWSTHASSTGPTRALYRTHTGFTASATPTGNVAMLTPGGHAAVMTAEGVYVGAANGRSS